MPQALEFFQNHPILVLAFIGIVGGLAWTFVAGRAGGVTRLGPSDVTRLINSEDAVVVDVRGDAEFRQGHIINALNVPEAQIDAELKRLEKHRTTPVILVCRTGQSAARSASALRKAGFEKVHILAGGIAGWEGASLPLVKK